MCTILVVKLPQVPLLLCAVFVWTLSLPNFASPSDFAMPAHVLCCSPVHVSVKLSCVLKSDLQTSAERISTFQLNKYQTQSLSAEGG